ncbi:[F-actin]-monooxygenase mical3 [Rhizophlyctis rosea]|nr:[F-actin]-monooxygenase mical3 [Rhizophlyctis rosea]
MVEAIRVHFVQFMDAVDVQDTLEEFEALRTSALSTDLYAFPPFERYEVLKQSLLPHLIYRQKTLFATLDAKRLSSSHIRSSLPTDSPPRTVISGAGPCGLRAAVESAILGHDVTVIEIRTEFSRHNVIKTWRCTIYDLMSLGLGSFMPNVRVHGHPHLGIRQIQMVLLKAALVLGVRVLYGVGVCGILSPDVKVEGDGGFDGVWRVWCLPAVEARGFIKEHMGTGAMDGTIQHDIPAELSLKPSETDTSRLTRLNKVDFTEPAISQDGAIITPSSATLSHLTNTKPPSSHLLPFTTFLIAEGESSRLIRHLGFTRRVTKFAEAIGIVINLHFSATATTSSSAPERQLPEYITSQSDAEWRSGPLGKLATIGLNVENLEYMRGTDTHFFVLTVKKGTLVDFGVVREAKGTTRETLGVENVDLGRLREFARRVASAGGVPEEAAFSERNGVQIFDFSSKGVCLEQVKVLSGGVDGEMSSLVMPIGDALQNPFWPQGLGINRGFHTSLDAVFTTQVFASTGDLSNAREELITARRAVDWVAFGERCLQPLEGTGKVWTADPVTRYSREIYKMMHMADVEKGVKSTLPARIREAFGLKM